MRRHDPRPLLDPLRVATPPLVRERPLASARILLDPRGFPAHVLEPRDERRSGTAAAAEASPGPKLRAANRDGRHARARAADVPPRAPGVRVVRERSAVEVPVRTQEDRVRGVGRKHQRVVVRNTSASFGERRGEEPAARRGATFERAVDVDDPSRHQARVQRDAVHARRGRVLELDGRRVRARGGAHAVSVRRRGLDPPPRGRDRAAPDGDAVGAARPRHARVDDDEAPDASPRSRRTPSGGLARKRR